MICLLSLVFFCFIIRLLLDVLAKMESLPAMNLYHLLESAPMEVQSTLSDSLTPDLTAMLETATPKKTITPAKTPMVDLQPTKKCLLPVSIRLLALL